MFFQRLLKYLNPATLFQKGDKNINLRLMHGINRISIFIFLICIIVMAFKYIF